MSGEIQATAKLVDSALDVCHEPATQSIDRSGTEMVGYVQSIGIVEETLTTLADVATVGWAYFENLDTTNFVQLGPATGSYFLKLLAGEKCVCPLNSATIYALADTAAVRLMVTILER